jgi:hypothetical protein
MNAPWDGPRHRSWASNSVVSGIVLVIILLATVITDWLNGPEPPPTYLTGLLGLAAGSFFGAVGTDKGKREREMETDIETAKSRAVDVNETAIRAETKADRAVELIKDKHPDANIGDLPPPMIGKGGE